MLNGIELGQPAYDVEMANKIVNTHDYDQILASVHNLRGSEDFYFMENLTLDEAEKLLYRLRFQVDEKLAIRSFAVNAACGE